METTRNKTGQHIDFLKEAVIIPTVARIIRASLPENQETLSLLEIGPGDGTSIKYCLDLLRQQLIDLQQLTLVEADRNIFGELLELTAAAPEYSKVAITFMEPALAAIFGPLLEAYEGAFDIANAQLVLHQIENPAVVSLYLAKTFMALKNSGKLLITDLHPNFLEYLQVNEPEKLEIISPTLIKYIYDSGGQQTIARRELVDLLTLGLETGFTLSRVVEHDLTPALGHKSRYHALQERNIPMIYTLVLAKRPERFLSYSEGKVESQEREGDFLKINFQDGTSREVPLPRDVEWLCKEWIVIQQVQHPTEHNKVITNLWTYPEEGIMEAIQHTNISYLRES